MESTCIIPVVKWAKKGFSVTSHAPSASKSEIKTAFKKKTMYKGVTNKTDVDSFEDIEDV